MTFTHLETETVQVDSSPLRDLPESIARQEERPAAEPPIRPLALDDLSASADPLRAAKSPDELPLRIEFGSAQLPRFDVQQFKNGTVIQLNELAHAPVHIFVDEQLVALGQLVTRDNKLCVQILKLIPTPHHEAA